MPTPVEGHPGVYRRNVTAKGVADVIACGPGGRFVAVEVKVGQDRLRPDQTAFLAGVNNRNGVSIECRDTVAAVLAAKDEICREVR